MATHVEDLPDELLLLILAQLPTPDLIDAVPYVSVRWRRLSLDFQLWSKRTCLHWWDSDASAVRYFSLGPALGAVAFQRSVGGAVLRCVAQHCPSITELNLPEEQRLGLQTLRAINRGCAQIRVLHINSDILSCRRNAREVALMPRLETLAVYGWRPLQLQLRKLGAGCTELRRLELYAANASLADLGAALLSRLRALVLCWKDVTRDIGLCAPSLQELTLRDYEDATRPGTAMAEDLEPLSALTRVDARCLNADRRLVGALMQPLLRVLTLSRCATLDDALLLQLSRRCPLLEELYIGRCDLITERGLGALWRLRRLRRLDLSECGGFGSGAALAEDLQPLAALTHVDAGFINADGRVLRALLQPQLRTLTLSGSPTLDDALLLQLCRFCPLLEDLDVDCCNLITARGLSDLWRLSRLRHLCLNRCQGLGSGAAAHLARCKSLQELQLERVDLQQMEPGVSQILELRRIRFLVVNAWSAKDLIPWESLPVAFPYLRILQLGEWMSLDTTLLESLKAALPTVNVHWFVSGELRDFQDSEDWEPYVELE